jgi:hypothetical protein
MLRIDVPNARLMDDTIINEPKSDLRGRDYYCHKVLGLKRLSKAYRDCKKQERQSDKGLTGEEKRAKADERRGEGYVPTDYSGGDDWVTNDNMEGTDDFRTSDDWSGDPSADAKDFGDEGRILGMEKSVGIPIVAISSIAILVGGILIVRKLTK